MLKMMLLIKGQSAEDDVADRKFKVLKMLLIEAVKVLMMMNTEY